MEEDSSEDEEVLDSDPGEEDEEVVEPDDSAVDGVVTMKDGVEWRFMGMPHVSMCSRKPEGQGLEMETLSDVETGIMIKWDLMEGKAAEKDKGKSSSETPSKRSRGGEGGAAAGAKKKAKVLLAAGVDQHGVPLLHVIQNLSANNRTVTCKMCGNTGAPNHCATCTERQGEVPFGLCGVGTGRSCIGRHFQESGK